MNIFLFGCLIFFLDPGNLFWTTDTTKRNDCSLATPMDVAGSFDGMIEPRKKAMAG